MIRVHIREAFQAKSLDVFIVREVDESRGGLLLQTIGATVAQPWNKQEWVPANDGEVLDTPSFSIPVEASHALLGALARTLGAVEHPEQLRKDYTDERARVDKLTDALISIAKFQ